MIHKDLCHASRTKYWTRNQIMFHLLLSSNYGWDGEVCLNLRQMAEKLDCHEDTIKRCIRNAVNEGILEEKGDKLFFLKAVDNAKNYVRHFSVLDSEEFMNEDINVIRFVLHMLQQGVYSKNYYFNIGFQKLFHRRNRKNMIIEEGLFNIYDAQTMHRTIELAKKYLVLASNAPEGIVRVVDIKDEYKQELIINEGEKLYIRRIFAKYDLPDVDPRVISEIIKVNSDYMKYLGLRACREIALDSLERLLTANSKFHRMVIESQFREVGNYYKAVCEEVEKNYSRQLERRQSAASHAYKILNGSKNKKLSKVIRSCAHLFKTQVDQMVQKINDEILNVNKYWYELLRKTSKTTTYISKLEKHPLFNQMTDLYQLVLSISNTRDTSDIEDFPFYNWLEPELNQIYKK